MPISDYLISQRRLKHERHKAKFNVVEHCRMVGGNTRFKVGQCIGDKSPRWKGGPFRKYGLSISGYDLILSSQNGVCAICGKPPKKNRLHIDHDHRTGKVRGLLCFRCNYGMGWFQDDISVLAKVLNYMSNAKDWRDLNVSH